MDLKHLFNYLYWSEEQKNYVYNQYDEEHYKAYEYVNSSWSAWCASASHEGYKLVPVEPPEDMDIKICRLVDHRIDVFEADRIYKAMIGAAP